MAGKLFQSARVAALRATAVNRVLDEARQVEARGRSLISLMRGQPDTPTPGPIVKAAADALRNGRTGYPDNRGEPELRQAVAEKLTRDTGARYDPDREILVTDGATGGLAAALGALIGDGDEVLLPDPIYDAYDSAIALWGGRALPVRSEIRNGRFSFDRAALEAAFTPRARVLLLNTPWNPVGTVLTTAELADAVAFAAAHDLILLSDEIYEAFVYDGRRHQSPAALSPEARKQTVLVGSLSKTFAMTGWRVGYSAGPVAIMHAMLLVLQQWSRGPATFVQDAATVALRMPPDFVHCTNLEYQDRRDLVVQKLRGLPMVEPLVPEGGLFVMLDVRRLAKRSDVVRRYLLNEMGVMVIDGAAYGPAGEGTLRISFAAGGEPLERGLDRLRAGLLRFAEEQARA